MDGEVKSIEIRGIERAGADNVCQDGSLNEAVGVVYKDGSLIPYRATEADANLPQGTRLIYLHKTYQQDNVLVYYENDNQEMVLAWATKEAVDNGTVQWDSDIIDTMPQGVELLECAFVGNMLVERRTDNIYYFVFNKDKRLYESRIVDFGTLPTAEIRADRGLWNETTEAFYDKDGSVFYGECNFDYGEISIEGAIDRLDDKTNFNASLFMFKEFRKTAVGLLTKTLGTVTEDGGLTGYSLAWCAWRLKTGEYISSQMPILLCPPHDKFGLKYYNLNEHNDDDPVQTLHLPTYINGELVTVPVNDTAIQQIHTMDILEPRFSTFNDTFNGETILLRFGYTDKRTQIDGDDDNTRSVGYVVSDIGNALTVTGGNYLSKEGYYIDKQQVLAPLFFTMMTGHSSKDVIGDMIVYSSYAECMANRLYIRVPRPVEQYKEEISSFCVFLSKEIMPFLPVSDEHHITNSKSTFRKITCDYDGFDGNIYAQSAYPIYRSKRQILDEIEKIESLYKVADIPFEKVVDYKDGKYLDLKGKLGDTLLAMESVGMNEVRKTVYNNGGLFTYNGRLHLFNHFGDDKIQLTLPLYEAGVGQKSAEIPISAPNFGRIDRWFVFTTVSGAGKKTVRVINDTHTCRTDDDEAHEEYFKRTFVIPPMLCYPTSDLDNVRVIAKMWTREDEQEQTFYTFDKTFIAKNNKTLGLSFAMLNDNFNPINVAEDVQEGVEPTVPQDETGIEENVGFIKVAETNLPNYFKPINDYKVGDGRIIALAQMSIAMTQDTFGAYPLLVFCTDGIYSLGIDQTGTIAYSSVAPFSREVCTNKNTICEIDGAVIFATDKGLMMATGQKVDAFNPMLNGTPKHIPQKDKSLGTGLYVYGNAVKHPRLVPLEKDLDKMQVIETKDFIDYLQDADTYVKYASAKTALVVFNKNKNFIYFIDIATRFATKLNICLDKCNNNYPSADFFNTSKDKRYNFEYDTAEGTTQCLLQTRPIKLVLANKASYRVLLNGYFHSTKEDAMAGLYVLGSLDADHWQLIGAKEKPLQGGFHDLGCLTERVSMKYIMIIAVGVLGCDSHIDSIEISTNTKYQNKLR